MSGFLWLPWTQEEAVLELELWRVRKSAAISIKQMLLRHMGAWMVKCNRKQLQDLFFKLSSVGKDLLYMT